MKCGLSQAVHYKHFRLCRFELGARQNARGFEGTKHLMVSKKKANSLALLQNTCRVVCTQQKRRSLLLQTHAEM